MSCSDVAMQQPGPAACGVPRYMGPPARGCPQVRRGDVAGRVMGVSRRPPPRLADCTAHRCLPGAETSSRCAVQPPARFGDTGSW